MMGMTNSKDFIFLPEESETAQVFRSIDWDHHELGPVSLWPQSLKISLQIIFHSRHPMFIWWGENLIQFYNDAYRPSFGNGKHPKAMGQPGEDCWPEIWPLIFPQIENVMKFGKPSWNENQLVPIFRNGVIEEVYWTYGFSPIYDEENKIKGVLVVCNETTKHVMAANKLLENEQKLKEARLELHNFIMQAPIGICILQGPEHVYSLINPKFMSLLFAGRRLSDFLNKTVKEALPELKNQGFYEILDEVYRTGKAFIGSKLRASMVQANGQEKELFINFTYQAKKNKKGRIDGILVVVYEVTDQVNEQKEIESLADNLRLAIIARDNFLGIASHELNTPLTSIKLQTQLNQKLLKKNGYGVFNEEKLSKFLDNTLTQTNRLTRLVNDMLDVSKINTGKIAITKSKTNLSTLVEESLERLGPQLEAVKCTLTKEIQENIYLSIDAMRIDQVICNIIINASKYAPRTAVHVKVWTEKGMAKVSIRDEGHGVALENHHRIFGRFERATSANEVSGMGLGLFISKQIILDHEGILSIESELGKGAAFTFELPLVEN